ncbi:MAG: NAD-dependent epimerase/dehydratase family protein [Anaerolineae bacterium]
MRVLVIGGAGMLGRAVARQMREAGHTVYSFDLVPSPEEGVESAIGDVRSAEAVSAACEGMDTVIHTASMVSQDPGKPQPVFDVNVQGTRNVIAACQRHHVSKLVYTSSIDVVFDGTPIRDGDETLPYPTRHLDYYGETKAIAEQAVIAANGTEGLSTCVLRAAGIYGPNDRHRFPRVLFPAAQTGTFTRLGNGRSMSNHVYVDNVAHAHVLAAQQLTGDHAAAGQCYFITDYAPSNFFEFFIPFLDALGIKAKQMRIPVSLALGFATVLEWKYYLSPVNKRTSPLFTRYSVAATSRDFWFNHRKASRDLGYAPLVSEQTAFDRTVDWAREALRSLGR